MRLSDVRHQTRHVDTVSRAEAIPGGAAFLLRFPCSPGGIVAASQKQYFLKQSDVEIRRHLESPYQHRVFQAEHTPTRMLPHGLSSRRPPNPAVRARR